MYGSSSERTIKVKDLDGKFIKVFDSHYNKTITFRKDYKNQKRFYRLLLSLKQTFSLNL